MENDEIGLGVGERGGGMGDLISEFGNRPWRAVGRAPRECRGPAARND
jgi:hypothetical protein